MSVKTEDIRVIANPKAPIAIPIIANNKVESLMVYA
jgi:hypothetical protein